jgi:hypothetical protein
MEGCELGVLQGITGEGDLDRSGIEILQRPLHDEELSVDFP